MFTADKNNSRGFVYKGPAIAFALLIFVLSSFPGDKLPEIGINFSDSLIHFVEFGLFGIFLYRAFRYPFPFSKPYLMTLCVGIPFAILDEIHQLFVPGRYCELSDFFADTLGLVVFAGISALIHPLKKSES